ncbi:MAG: prepilin-type N-terminal cleavage/methylation domain-containing protein [Candidatus Roizmanbacteria bacterium]|nr:prepilin-type N-terminal cleavage/methylation domain-containing protein [Candidatus Roizmanbacteria bacterium]
MFSRNTSYKQHDTYPGFSLAEMMIVVSIISILVTATAIGGINVVNRSRAQATAHQIEEIKAGVKVYFIDTHSFPPSLSIGDAANPNRNGLLTAPAGVTGWNGPYVPEKVVFEHHWGGGIRWVNEADGGATDSDPVNNFFIVLDDDAPGTGFGDNSGIMPTSIMVLVDEIMDDGNLVTGEVRGNGCNVGLAVFNSACNELMIRVRQSGI